MSHFHIWSDMFFILMSCIFWSQYQYLTECFWFKLELINCAFGWLVWWLNQGGVIIGLSYEFKYDSLEKNVIISPVMQRFQSLLQSGMQESGSLSMDKIIIKIIITTLLLIYLHASICKMCVLPCSLDWVCHMVCERGGNCGKSHKRPNRPPSNCWN